MLGMDEVTFGGDRLRLSFGAQKLNLHPRTAGCLPVVMGIPARDEWS